MCFEAECGAGAWVMKGGKTSASLLADQGLC